MPLFFTISDSEIVELDENDSRHAIKSLRLKEGDAVHLINGAGKITNAIITIADSKKQHAK